MCGVGACRKKVFIEKRESYLPLSRVKCAVENYFLKADVSIRKSNDKNVKRGARRILLREVLNTRIGNPMRKNAILTDVTEEPMIFFTSKI